MMNNANAAGGVGGSGGGGDTIILSKLVSKSVASVQKMLNKCLVDIAHERPEIRTEMMVSVVSDIRTILLKLYSIVSWYKNNAEFFVQMEALKQDIMNDIGHLDNSQHYLADVGNSLFFKRSRVFEVKVAMDILASQGYFSLPESIFVGRASEPTLPRYALMKDLNIFIRAKLRLFDRMPLRLSKFYKVANGALTIHVPHLYELSLSLSHLSETADWIVVGFKTLVHSVDAEDMMGTFNYIEFDYKMFEVLRAKSALPSTLTTSEDPRPIISGGNNSPELLSSTASAVGGAEDMAISNSGSSGNSSSSDSNSNNNREPMTLEKYQIMCEHSCYSAAIRLFLIQANVASQGFWRGNMGVEFIELPDKFVVAVRFWRGSVVVSRSDGDMGDGGGGGGGRRERQFRYEFRLIQNRKPKFNKLRNGSATDEYTLGDALFNCEIWSIDPNRKYDGTLVYSPCFPNFQDYVPLHDCVLNGVSFTRIWGHVISFMGQVNLNVLQERLSYCLKKDSWEQKGLEHAIEEESCEFILKWGAICNQGLAIKVSQFDGSFLLHSLIMNESITCTDTKLGVFLKEINSLQSELALLKALKNEDYVSFCCQKVSTIASRKINISSSNSLNNNNSSSKDNMATMENISFSGSLLTASLDDEKGSSKSSKVINSINSVILDLYISSVAVAIKRMSILPNKQSLSFEMLESLIRLQELNLDMANIDKYRCLVYSSSNWPSLASLMRSSSRETKMKQNFSSSNSSNSSSSSSSSSSMDLGVWHSSSGLSSSSSALDVGFEGGAGGGRVVARRASATGLTGSDQPNLVPDVLAYFVVLLDSDLTITFIGVICESASSDSCLSKPKITEVKVLSTFSCVGEKKSSTAGGMPSSNSIKVTFDNHYRESMMSHFAFISSKFDGFRSELSARLNLSERSKSKCNFLHSIPLGSYKILKPSIVDNETLLFKLHRVTSNTGIGSRVGSEEDFAVSNYVGSFRFELLFLETSAWLNFTLTQMGGGEDWTLQHGDLKLAFLEQSSLTLLSTNFNFVTESIDPANPNELDVFISNSNTSLYFYNSSSSGSSSDKSGGSLSSSTLLTQEDLAGFENYAEDVERLYEKSLIQKINSSSPSVDAESSPTHSFSRIASSNFKADDAVGTDPSGTVRIQIDNFFSIFLKAVSTVTPLAMSIYLSSASPSLRLEYIFDNCLLPKALFAVFARQGGVAKVVGYLEALVDYKMSKGSFELFAANNIILKDLVKDYSQNLLVTSFASCSAFNEKLINATNAYLTAAMPNKKL